MFVCSSVWGEFRGSRHGNLRSNNKTESEPAAPDGAEKWVDSVSVAEFKRLNIQNVQDQQNITGLFKKKKIRHLTMQSSVKIERTWSSWTSTLNKPAITKKYKISKRQHLICACMCRNSELDISQVKVFHMQHAITTALTLCSAWTGVWKFKMSAGCSF